VQAAELLNTLFDPPFSFFFFLKNVFLAYVTYAIGVLLFILRPLTSNLGAYAMRMLHTLQAYAGGNDALSSNRKFDKKRM